MRIRPVTALDIAFKVLTVGLALTLKVRQACRETAPQELREAVLNRLANA